MGETGETNGNGKGRFDLGRIVTASGYFASVLGVAFYAGSLAQRIADLAAAVEKNKTEGSQALTDVENRISRTQRQEYSDLAHRFDLLQERLDSLSDGSRRRP